VGSALELFAAHGGRAAEITVDLSLGRGLRYYTGLVFEVYHDAPGGPLQLCGGGRYDELIRALGGRGAVPAVGFSYGLERLDLVLGGGQPAGPVVDLLLAPLEAADLPSAALLAEQLRDAGVRVELDVRLRGARANLRHADRTGIPLALLVGARERERGEALLRRMASRQEWTVKLDELTPTVCRELAERAANGSR
jgi:histidyl-tRNA synthetase